MRYPLIESISFVRVIVWPLLKDIIEHIKNMLEFPNLQCSQNAITAAGNLLISIHQMIDQTQEKQLVQNGKILDEIPKIYRYNFQNVIVY